MGREAMEVGEVSLDTRRDEGTGNSTNKHYGSSKSGKCNDSLPVLKGHHFQGCQLSNHQISRHVLISASKERVLI
jgi:hypothetical protein